MKYHSVRLARVAATVKTSGHFDKVIEAIDQMHEVLRKEEQDDIAHRDRCEISTHNNNGAMEDLNHDIDRSKKALEKMDDKKTSLNNEISTLDDEINATQKSMAELLELRNK